MSIMLEIDCPAELLAELHADAEGMRRLLKDKTALALFKEGRLSSGLASRWLGEPRVHFLFRAMQEGAVLGADSEDEVRRELAGLE